MTMPPRMMRYFVVFAIMHETCSMVVLRNAARDGGAVSMGPMRSILVLLGVSLILSAGPAQSQSYPTKPIHMLVPYAPGGPADIAARLLGARLTQAWGQQVVVENRPGGNGFIGMTAAAKAAPDGHALVLATIAELAITPALFPDLPYGPERDFAPISSISDAAIVLAAHGESSFTSVADVIAAAKAASGRISVGSPGNGTINHIVLEWMALNTGSKFQHIPYKGGAPVANAVAAGEILLAVTSSSSVAPHLKSGRVRVLAVASAKRSKFAPDWPTLQQQGVADVDASIWTALLAPKSTPQPIIDKLNVEVVKALDMPDIKERFAGVGAETIPSSAAELNARIRQDAAQFGVIVRKAKIQPD
jgi:tripartite-type tricarboxylate transporter receptor subunit TctC